MSKEEKNGEFILAGAEKHPHSENEVEAMKETVLTFGKVAAKSSINERSKLRNPVPKMSLS